MEKKRVQIGIVAMRTPDGDFLPATPIYAEETPTMREREKTMCQFAGEFFAEKMKQYIDGLKESRLKP